jgi:hypothetical protein
MWSGIAARCEILRHVRHLRLTDLGGPSVGSACLSRDTGDVEGRCTCGAILPPDARFCHKCGKPQFEEPNLEEAVQDAPAPVVVPAAATQTGPADINFRNSVAVRACLMAAALVCLLISIPIPPPLNIIWQLVLALAGGFFSVFLYMRRTGEQLSVRRGAQLGWITGVFCFVFMILLITFALIAITSSPEVADAFRKSVGETGAMFGSSDDAVRQIDSLLSSRSRLAGLVFFTLLFAFCVMTLVPAIGGALGAKVLEKE